MGKTERESNGTEQLRITSATDLAEFSKGNLVKLPDFAEGQPFVAMLKRPSVVTLLSNGMIPNPLLPAAMELFEGEQDKKEENRSLDEKAKEYQDTRTVLEIVAKSTLVSPTYQEIEEAGIELTTQQLYAIYNYTQVGLKDMLSFRPGQKS